ncbi:MAG: hypothetical protein AAGF53_10540 [Pseudomonadota bacterium]
MRAITRAAYLSVVLVLSAALVLVGFAHKLQQPSNALDPAVQAYLSQGGTLSDICLTGDEGEQYVFECDACLVKNNIASTRSLIAFCDKDHSLLSQGDLAEQQIPVVYALDLSRASRAPPIL